MQENQGESIPGLNLFAEPQSGIWVGSESDIPVIVIGSYGQGPDGKEYLAIEGSTTAIPADEFSPSLSEQKVFRVSQVMQRISIFFSREA